MTGYIVKLGDGVVNWAARKQATVALSTCEAEYCAKSVAAQETIWMRNVLKDFGLQEDGPTRLMSDNCSGISWANGEKLPGKRAKHIDVRVHYIRELVRDGKIKVSYVPSEENDADFLTKPLSRVSLERVMDRISLNTAVEEEY